MTKRVPRFKVGDTISNGYTWYTIQYVYKDSYKIETGDTGPGMLYMPVNLTDKFWWLSDDSEIVDE